MKLATFHTTDRDNREKTVKLHMSPQYWKQLDEELFFTRKHCMDGLTHELTDVSPEDIDEMKDQIRTRMHNDTPLFLTKHELTVLWHANCEYHTEYDGWKNDREKKFNHNRVVSFLVNCSERFEKGIVY